MCGNLRQPSLSQPHLVVGVTLEARWRNFKVACHRVDPLASLDCLYGRGWGLIGPLWKQPLMHKLAMFCKWSNLNTVDTRLWPMLLPHKCMSCIWRWVLSNVACANPRLEMPLINPLSSPSRWITTLNEKSHSPFNQHANGVATRNIDNITPNVGGQYEAIGTRRLSRLPSNPAGDSWHSSKIIHPRYCGWSGSNKKAPYGVEGRFIRMWCH